MGSVVRISGRAWLMVRGLWCGCRQMAGAGVWRAQGQLAGLPFQVVVSPLVWSLPLGESELPPSMATKSFKRQRPSEQRRSRSAFYEPALEVTECHICHPPVAKAVSPLAEF